MKQVLNKAMKGHALLLDSSLECVEAAEAGYKKRRFVDLNDRWAGNTFSSWKSLSKSFVEADSRNLDKVEDMLRELRESDIPAPQSRKRRRRWNDTSGEVDVDRVLRGELEYMHDMVRDVKTGPTNVTLYCNLDAYGGDTSDKVFWRGAAAIAAADLLEDAGFSTEIWVWCAGRGVFAYPNPNQFTAMPVKAMTDPIDISNLTNTLSCWFLRLCIFNAFNSYGESARGLGSPVYDLGDWKRLIVTDPSTSHELFMPIVSSKEEAIDAAKEMLRQMMVKGQFDTSWDSWSAKEQK